MSDSFTGELWQSVSGIFEAILSHPFLTGLADGSLSEESFAFYVIQDSLYLKQYGHTLAAIASRAPDASETEMFARHFIGVVAVEQQLHDTLLADLGIDPGVGWTGPRWRPPPWPIPATCSPPRGAAPTRRASAQCCPCYWIYWEVGKELRRRGRPNRASAGLDTYGSEDFGTYVREVLDVTNRLAADLSADERARMHWHFSTTSRYEWMFWDMGLRTERWPISL